MGSAVWLYGWLILRQTHQTGTVGWVLGGAPIHYREIEEETGFNRRTLERWMKLLRRQKYVETAVVEGGITIKILKAKKHLYPANGARDVRGIAGGVRRAAGSDPQSRVANADKSESSESFAGRIGSSSVVRIKDKDESQILHPVENVENPAVRDETASYSNDVARRQAIRTATTTDNFHTFRSEQNRAQSTRPADSANARASGQQDFSWEMRERIRWMRAERDDAVKRELFVGSGPEVPHK